MKCAVGKCMQNDRKILSDQEGLHGVFSPPSVKVSLKPKTEVEDPIAALKDVTTGLVDVVLGEGVSGELVRGVIKQAGKFESLVMKLMLENEKLKGRIEELEKRGSVPCVPVQMGASLAPIATGPPQSLDSVSKPVETWSVVVCSKNATTTPKEVVSKVVKEVAPALDVRVHEVKPIRGGGAVIRTPSIAERNKIVSNKKFVEVGLEAYVNEKAGPRVVVQKVHAEISPDEFMGELFEKNLKESMSLDSYKKNVRLVSAPWKVGPGEPVNVILEGSGSAMNALLKGDRCYIKWFSFPMRAYEPFIGCFRCMSVDHMRKDCRLKEDVCRRCGQMGHLAIQCNNALTCRNCAFKGKPSGHLMMSSACPMYSALVARAKARH